MTPTKTKKHILSWTGNLNPLTAVGLALFGIILVAALAAPIIAPYDPLEQNIFNRLQGASADHWLGTDVFGRDTLSRILYGAQISLVIGLTSTGIALVAGTGLGIVAGYYGGWT